MSGSNSSVQSGRPRSPEADLAIYEACIQLLSKEGFPATTIDAVASRSGVGRPTIYRRFSNRSDLIESCVEEIISRDVPTVAPSDSPMRDVLALLDSTRHMLTETPLGGIMRNALPYLPKYQRTADMIAAVGNRRRSALKEALQRAVEEGSIKAPTDIDILIDCLIGAIYSRYLTTNQLRKTYPAEVLKELTGQVPNTNAYGRRKN